MSLIYPGGDEQVTPSLGLATWGMDEVLANNMILIDTAIGAGSSVKVNSVSISNPNFNNTTPAAPGGNTNVTFQVIGSNVSAYVPTAVPAGSVNAIQYNNSGVFGGSAATVKSTGDTYIPTVLGVGANSTPGLINGIANSEVFPGTSQAYSAFDVAPATFTSSPSSGSNVGISVGVVGAVNAGLYGVIAEAIIPSTYSGNISVISPVAGYFQVDNFGTGTFLQTTAVSAFSNLWSTATVTKNVALAVESTNRAGGHVADNWSIQANASNTGPGATTQSNIAIYAQSGNGSTGTNVNDVTIYIDSPLTSGTFTSPHIGLFIADQTTAGALSNAYALQIAGGKVDLGPGFSVPWSTLGNAAANLTLANSTFTTTFDQTTSAVWTWANTTPAASAPMTVGFIASGVASLHGTNPITLNTTGATLLVAVVTASSAVATISDSNGNTWNYLTTRTSTNNANKTRIAYAFGPTVGAGHTFTVGGGTFAVAFVYAFSNTVTTSSVFDNENGGPCTGSTFQPGSVTRTTGDVTITGWGSNAVVTTGSINDSFTGLLSDFNVADEAGQAAYLVDTSASSINPTWTTNTGAPQSGATAIASFKAATGAAANQSSPILTLSGTYFNGAVSTIDSWTIQDVLASMANPTSTLTLAHTGSSGLASVSVPALIVQGLIGTYNGISTVSNGVPSELATSDLTVQSAAISATTLYTTTATGMYRVSWSATITTAGTTSVLGGTNGFQVIYTSPTDSVVKTTVAGNSVTSSANTTGTAVGGCEVVYAKTGTNIQFTYGYTSSGTAMVYELHIKVEAL
jgi:hypothetical protein